MLRNRSPHFSRISAGLTVACTMLIFLLSGCVSASTKGTQSSPGPSGNVNPGTPAAAVLGYVWDSRLRGLRSLNGALGAAQLGKVIVGSESFSGAVPCVSRGFALLTSSTGAISVMFLPAGQVTAVIEPIAKNPHIQLSPSCSNALIYSPETSIGLLINGLPSSPQPHSVNLDSSGLVVGAAVGDTGSILIADLDPDGAVAVRVLGDQGNQSQALATMQNYGAMRFLPGGNSVVLADSGANTVTLVSEQSAGPVLTQLGSAAGGVSKPLAISGSADGRFVFVANGSGGPILRFDLSGGYSFVSTPCKCIASELIPLSGNAIFELNDPAAGTIFALEGDARAPRTIFIPTDKVNSASGGVQ